MTPGTRVRAVLDGQWRTGTVVDCPVACNGIHVHFDGDGIGKDCDPWDVEVLA